MLQKKRYKEIVSIFALEKLQWMLWKKSSPVIHFYKINFQLVLNIFFLRFFAKLECFSPTIANQKFVSVVSENR